MEDVDQTNRKLTITTCNQSSKVQITVRDTGPGIADPEIIFEPFYSTKHDGIGLGLPICRTIVSAHGGTLAARNIGVGAAFCIELPIDTSAASQKIAANPTASLDPDGATA
jgi:two-component system sensor kinase FixL